MTLRQFLRMCVCIIGLVLTAHVVLLLGDIGLSQWRDASYALSMLSFAAAWSAFSVGTFSSVLAARRLVRVRPTPSSQYPLSERLWRRFARFCAIPKVSEWIVHRAVRTPYEKGHLQGYMLRYTLIPNTVRLFGRRVHLPITARVHIILREDRDRHLHDHPWDHRSIVLHGWYDEEDVFGNSQVVHAGATVKRRAETFHRINRVSTDGVVSLFITRNRRNRWGYLRDGHKVYYREYLGLVTNETSAGKVPS